MELHFIDKILAILEGPQEKRSSSGHPSGKCWPDSQNLIYSNGNGMGSPSRMRCENAGSRPAAWAFSFT